MIARFPEGTATSTLRYDYEYEVNVKGKIVKKTGSTLKIPNEWIVDAVN